MSVPPPTTKEAAAIAVLARRAAELQPCAVHAVPVQIDERLMAGMRGCALVQRDMALFEDDQVLLGLAARLAQLGALASASAISCLTALDERTTGVRTMPPPTPRPVVVTYEDAGDGRLRVVCKRCTAELSIVATEAEARAIAARHVLDAATACVAPEADRG